MLALLLMRDPVIAADPVSGMSSDAWPVRFPDMSPFAVIRPVTVSGVAIVVNVDVQATTSASPTNKSTPVRPSIYIRLFVNNNPLLVKEAVLLTEPINDAAVGLPFHGANPSAGDVPIERSKFENVGELVFSNA